MKLSVMSPVLSEMGLEGALAYLAKAGVHSMELGCGGYPGDAHCSPDKLLNDDGAYNDFTALLKKYNMTVIFSKPLQNMW